MATHLRGFPRDDILVAVTRAVEWLRLRLRGVSLVLLQGDMLLAVDIELMTYVSGARHVLQVCLPVLGVQ